jgi:hypothetical protein
MNLKGAGFVPFFAIFCCFSLALGLKLEVEVTTPITKARSLPSSSSDPKGFVRSGQTFIVDGESGEWYRINVYNSFVWIPKDAVKILRSEEDPTAAPVSTGSAGQQPSALPPGTTVTVAAPSAPPTSPQPIQRGERIDLLPARTGQSPAVEARKNTPAGSVAATFPATEQKNQHPDGFSKNEQQQPGTIRPAAVARAYQEPTPPASQTWFSKRSLFPQAPLDADGKEVVYFQVSITTASVFAARTSSSTVLTKAKKGDYFQLIEHDGYWCKVSVNDTAGWIELAGGAIVNAPKTGFFDEYFLIIIIAGAFAILALGLIVFFLFRGKGRKKSPGATRFNGLIIARSVPDVQGAISGKPVPLDKYLTSIGISVASANRLVKAQKIIDKRRLAVVFIDWNISDDIPGTVEILFTSLEQKNLPLAVFFNVAKTTEVPLIPVLLRAYHLGASFSDHDIYKLITPAMLSDANRKTGAASALEGDIADGNLPEIMEFIEIGKKTGALTIETESPLGVIYFTEGRVVHAAATNGVFGRDAINILLNLKQGTFKFLLDKQPKTRDLNLSTLEVLMEWTKNEDEAHRD